jgi:tetratricopeptide (TPR) repeat protein/2-polyprenyl-3-methyl-5-hydroxy-6-metoxy-1,4-benzoquinol methylase
MATRPDSAAARALAFHQRGDFARAVDAYREALAFSPNKAELHFNLGTALHALGRLDDAIAAYREAVRLQPGLMVAHDNLGNALAAAGRTDDALASYRAAMRLAPSHPGVRYNVAVALHRSGRVDEAIAAYRDAGTLAPDSWPLQYNLGIALESRGRLDDAIAAYRRAVALHPRNADVLARLGNALLSRGLADDAIACLAAAVQQRPADAHLRNNLGNALDQRGDAAAAILCYRDALAIEDTAAIRGNLARSLAHVDGGSLDAEMRGLLARAIRESWVRPADLALRAGEAIDARAPHGGLRVDPLVLALLEATPVRTPALERRLTAERRAGLLEAASVHDATPVDDDALAFACALARQCFQNEYVFAEDEDERRAVLELCARLDAALARPDDVPLRWLVAIASYRALGTLGCAVEIARRSWPAPIAALVAQQIVEPAEDARAALSIGVATPLAQEASERVRRQYEDHPYPRWSTHAYVAAEPSFTAYLQRRFPLAGIESRNDDLREALIAGCGTGQESTEFARTFPGAAVLGIDLSVTSLGYAARQARVLGLRNLEYAQGDLLCVGQLGRTFDVVSCVGVLHHLADPASGLAALVRVLRPGGFMRLGFYSEAGRRDIAFARGLLEATTQAVTDDSVRAARQVLLQREQDVGPLLTRADFYSLSTCRDLLFPAEEHCTTLPELAGLLERHGLQPIGFLLQPAALQAYRDRFPADPAARDFAGWHAFEQEHPRTFAGMYRFWVRKAD